MRKKAVGGPPQWPRRLQRCVDLGIFLSVRNKQDDCENNDKVLIEWLQSFLVKVVANRMRTSPQSVTFEKG